MQSRLSLQKISFIFAVTCLLKTCHIINYPSLLLTHVIGIASSIKVMTPGSANSRHWLVISLIAGRHRSLSAQRRDLGQLGAAKQFRLPTRSVRTVCIITIVTQ